MVQTAERKQQIGLLGGTFDPVHNGHLAVADHVQHTLELDTILFIPAYLPPHKPGQAVTSFSHRFAMLEKAIAENNSFAVSDIEAKRSAPSYSIDTINLLVPQIGDQTNLFFIIGADAFLEINTWKRYKELPALVNFVVISRTTYSPDKVGKVIGDNFADYVYDPSHETWNSPSSRGSFILQHMEPVPISSTDIREKVRCGKDITGLVPPAVENYIKKQCLYIK
jgi:nicotinate-nucleotide adenylyltransferase